MAATEIPSPAPTFKVLLKFPEVAEPPPVRPFPAVTVTPVISPTFVVYPKEVIRSFTAAAVIRTVSESEKDSEPVCIEVPANSETVNPETFKVTPPEVPPPVRPVPALTPVIVPTFVVYP